MGGWAQPALVALASRQHTPRPSANVLDVHSCPSFLGTRWYEPQHFLLGPSYYLHSYGSIYAVSGRAVESVIVRNHDSLRLLANEVRAEVYMELRGCVDYAWAHMHAQPGVCGSVIINAPRPFQEFPCMCSRS